jgi:hypothetical protein
MLRRLSRASNRYWRKMKKHFGFFWGAFCVFEEGEEEDK